MKRPGVLTLALVGFLLAAFGAFTQRERIMSVTKGFIQWGKDRLRVVGLLPDAPQMIT